MSDGFNMQTGAAGRSGKLQSLSAGQGCGKNGGIVIDDCCIERCGRMPLNSIADLSSQPKDVARSIAALLGRTADISKAGFTRAAVP
jgi:hypothetical protein